MDCVTERDTVYLFCGESQMKYTKCIEKATASQREMNTLFVQVLSKFFFVGCYPGPYIALIYFCYRPCQGS